jgi:DHA1 family multidrug resistance protein-like MFS transporter
MVIIGFAFILGMGFSRAFLPILANQLDPSGVLVGSVTSAWFLARIFIELPSGLLSQRLGRRNLLVSGLACGSMGALLCAVAPSIYVLILGRAIWGLGAGFFFTNSTALILDLFDSSVRGRAVGTFRGIEFTGSFIGTPIGAFLASFLGFRDIFSITCALTVVTCLLAFFSPGLRQSKGGQPGGTPGPSFVETIKKLLQDRRVMTICFGTFSRMFAMQGVMSTVFQLYLHQSLGFSIEVIGVIMSARTAGLIVATIFAGYLSDRFGREPVIIGGFLLASICLVLYTLVTAIESIVVTGIVDGLGSGMVSTTLMVFLSDLVEPQVIGGAVGLYRTFMDLGGIIGPLVVMTLFTAIGPIIPFFVAAGLALVNLALITVTWLRTRSAT